MTSPAVVPTPPPSPAPRPRWLPSQLVVLVAALLVAGLVFRSCAPLRRALLEPKSKTTITHSLVVERVQAVAKLVSSEATVRDVVTYQDTRMWSTKRSLVIVTGKILTGFVLDSGMQVRVDEGAKRITITLPRARVLAVEITGLQTYDERSGLLNPFRPEDRDAIFAQARSQLLHSAVEMGNAEVANRSARDLLEKLFSTDGYTAEVVIANVDVGGGPKR